MSTNAIAFKDLPLSDNFIYAAVKPSALAVGI